MSQTDNQSSFIILEMRRYWFMVKQALNRYSRKLWFWPLLTMLLTLFFFLATITLDANLNLQASDNWLIRTLIFGGDAPAVRSILSTITGSWTTIMGVVFSITVVALQLASNKFTSQVVPQYEHDVVTQATLSSFVGVVTYSLLVLKTLRGSEDTTDAFVPYISTGIAMLWALISLGLIVIFIQHLSTRMRPLTLTRQITNQGIQALKQLIGPTHLKWIKLKDEASSLDGEEKVSIKASSPGYIQAVGWQDLFHAIREILSRLKESETIHLELAKNVDDKVRPGDVIAILHLKNKRRSITRELKKWINTIYAIDRQRSITQDPVYAAEELLNLGQKSLVSGDTDVSAQSFRGLTNFYLNVIQQYPMPNFIEVIHENGHKATVSIKYPPLREHLTQDMRFLFTKTLSNKHLNVLLVMYEEVGLLLQEVVLQHHHPVSATGEKKRKTKVLTQRYKESATEVLDVMREFFQESLKLTDEQLKTLLNKWGETTTATFEAEHPLNQQLIDFYMDAYQTLLEKKNKEKSIQRLQEIIRGFVSAAHKSAPQTYQHLLRYKEVLKDIKLT